MTDEFTTTRAELWYFMRGDDAQAVKELYNLVASGMRPGLIPLEWPADLNWVVTVPAGAAAPQGGASR
jgi:hypothetical protein